MLETQYENTLLSFRQAMISANYWPPFQQPVFVPVNLTVQLPPEENPTMVFLNGLWLCVQIVGGVILAVKAWQEIQRAWS